MNNKINYGNYFEAPEYPDPVYVGVLQTLNFEKGKWEDVGDEEEVECADDFFEQPLDTSELELGKYRLAVFSITTDGEGERDRHLEEEKHFWIESKVRWETSEGPFARVIDSDESLIQRLLASHSLMLLHKEKGLEQHRKHSEEQMELTKKEILKRMKR